MKFKKFVESKDNKKVSKIDMYFNYFKNLAPKGFKVVKDKENNQIIIKID